jgi:hypothetical protein
LASFGTDTAAQLRPPLVERTTRPALAWYPTATTVIPSAAQAIPRKVFWAEEVATGFHAMPPAETRPVRS